MFHACKEFLIQGSQARDSGGKLEEELIAGWGAMEECCLLTHSLWLPQPFLNYPGPPASVLGPPTENTPQYCLNASLMEAFSSLRFLLPRCVGLCAVDPLSSTETARSIIFGGSPCHSAVYISSHEQAEQLSPFMSHKTLELS